MATREAPSTTLRRPAGRGIDVDGILLRRAANGDDDAFEVFYEEHVDALLGYCQHMLGSRHEAEDAVQQTFFSAYRHIAAGKLPEKPKAWLYTIARNRALSTIRARHESAAEISEPAGPALTDEVERRAELRQLVQDLNRLPEEQRSALVLFELAGLPQADIARVLEREPEQVRALVYQARSSLMAGREARDMACERVREQLSVTRGGRLNAGPLRKHLDGCDDCKRYLEDLRRQRRSLGVVLPVAPLVLAHGAAKTGAVGVAASRLARLHGRLAHLHGAAAPAAGAAAVVAAVATLVAVVPGSDHRAKRVPARSTGAAAPHAASHPRAKGAGGSHTAGGAHAAAKPKAAAKRGAPAHRKRDRHAPSHGSRPHHGGGGARASQPSSGGSGGHHHTSGGGGGGGPQPSHPGPSAPSPHTSSGPSTPSIPPVTIPPPSTPRDDGGGGGHGHGRGNGTSQGHGLGHGNGNHTGQMPGGPPGHR